MSSVFPHTTGGQRRSVRGRFRATAVLVGVALPALFGTAPAGAQKYTARILYNSGFTHSSARATHNGTHVGLAWNGGTGNLKGDPRIDFHPDNDAMLDGTRTSHAARWSGPTGAFTDMHPMNSNYNGSQAHGIQGDTIVGYGFFEGPVGGGTGTFSGALKWTISNNAVDDIDADVRSRHARAIGIDGTRISGWGIVQFGGERERGLAWRPAYTELPLSGGYNRARAYGMYGLKQVGYAKGPGDTGTNDRPRAALWTEEMNGTFTLRDLHPSGNLMSAALAIHDTQQVGFASPGGWEGAMLWEGAAENAVPLNPQGFANSRAYGVRFRRQVGYGTPIVMDASGNPVEGNAHALLWVNSANHYLDLHSLLGPGYVASRAYGIGEKANLPNEAGDIVGEAVRSDGTTQAVVWEATPAALQNLTGPSTIATRANLVVSLDGWAHPGGAVITLSSSHTRVKVPASITIAEATRSAFFSATINRNVLSPPLPTGVTITATYKGVTKSLYLRITQ